MNNSKENEKYIITLLCALICLFIVRAPGVSKLASVFPLSDENFCGSYWPKDSLLKLIKHNECFSYNSTTSTCILFREEFDPREGGAMQLSALSQKFKLKFVLEIYYEDEFERKPFLFLMDETLSILEATFSCISIPTPGKLESDLYLRIYRCIYSKNEINSNFVNTDFVRLKFPHLTSQQCWKNDAFFQLKIQNIKDEFPDAKNEHFRVQFCSSSGSSSSRRRDDITAPGVIKECETSPQVTEKGESLPGAVMEEESVPDEGFFDFATTKTKLFEDTKNCDQTLDEKSIQKHEIHLPYWGKVFEVFVSRSENTFQQSLKVRLQDASRKLIAEYFWEDRKPNTYYSDIKLGNEDGVKIRKKAIESLLSSKKILLPIKRVEEVNVAFSTDWMSYIANRTVDAWSSGHIEEWIFVKAESRVWDFLSHNISQLTFVDESEGRESGGWESVIMTLPWAEISVQAEFDIKLRYVSKFCRINFNLGGKHLSLRIAYSTLEHNAFQLDINLHAIDLVWTVRFKCEVSENSLQCFGKVNEQNAWTRFQESHELGKASIAISPLPIARESKLIFQLHSFRKQINLEKSVISFYQNIIFPSIQNFVNLINRSGNLFEMIPSRKEKAHESDNINESWQEYIQKKLKEKSCHNENIKNEYWAALYEGNLGKFLKTFADLQLQENSIQFSFETEQFLEALIHLLKQNLF